MLFKERVMDDTVHLCDAHSKTWMWKIKNCLENWITVWM